MSTSGSSLLRGAKLNSYFGGGDCELENALLAAIPEGEYQRIIDLAIAKGEPGKSIYRLGVAYVYPHPYATGIIATYNNTRKSPEEIIEWFERAMALYGNQE